MENTIHKSSRIFRLLLSALIITLAWSVWLPEAINSPVLNRQIEAERDYLNDILFYRSPQFEVEKQSAEAYWKRYPEIADHWLWGKNGELGIRGPKDHYERFGKWEGRIWQNN